MPPSAERTTAIPSDRGIVSSAGSAGGRAELQAPAGPDTTTSDDLGPCGRDRLLSLSALVLEARGCRLIEPPEGVVAAPFDLIAFDTRTPGLVAVAVTTRRGRLGTLRSLLSSAAAARLARRGTQVEVHCWVSRAGGRVVEVVEVRPGDFV
jgi:hypothetical protein